MSELNEFLKVLAEAKKEKKEHIEEAKKDMDSFFDMVAQVKAQDPKHQMLKKVKQQVQEDITTLFSELSKAKKPVVVSESAEQHIDSLVESVQLINEIESNVVGEFVMQEGKFVDPVTLSELTVPEVRPAAEMYTKAEIDDLLKRNASFQQPDPKLVDANINAVQQKLKFLEQAVGKIAAAGPGSGEVNFRYLDDVVRSTMTPSNDNWVLEYDAASKKVQFTEHIGPIRSIKLNTQGPSVELVAGQVAYNPNEDCVDIRHADGSTLQAGLEQHMQVYNHSDTSLVNGTVVRFAGVNGDGDETPIVEPHIADGTVAPLFTVGVLTNSIPSNTVGRATTYGKVRNLNTTGSDVGETWQMGDILYVSPTNAGKLTRVKPTAPNIVVVVAAVLKVHATEGVLLVRPTIFPRLHYGSFSDTTDQNALAINTPYAVKYNTTDIANGHQITNNSRIVALNSGLYNYQFSLQLSSSSSSQKQVYIWARKNGNDIPNSATRVTIAGNGYYAVAAWNFIISMNANDYFQLMWATDDLGARIDAPPATQFCPAVPSVILTVTEAAL